MSTTVDLTKPAHGIPHTIFVVARVVSFWAAAAALVWFAGRRGIAPPIAAMAVKAAAIVVAAFLYMRIAAREATLDHALFTGVGWLALSIGAELVTAGKADLLVRSAMMFVWVVAPALFATRQS
jgi:hypothetical protein